MLEKCLNLEQCEAFLSSQLQDIKLIGEIPLSFRDVSRLETFLKEIVQKNSFREIDFITTEAPTSLSCYLVWKGIIGYCEGEYWNNIEKGLGIDFPNWQSKLGKFFINFLHKNDLFLLKIEGSHKYLTPILFHGGIPNSCMEEFFEKVLFRLIKDILFDPSNVDEIKHELLVQREYYSERENIEFQIEKLSKEKENISGKIKSLKQQVNALERVKELQHLLNIAEDPKDYEALPEDYEIYRSRKNDEIKALEISMSDLQNEKYIFKKQINDFEEHYAKFIDNEYEIKIALYNYGILKDELRKYNDLKHRKKITEQEISTKKALLFSKPYHKDYKQIILKLNLSEIESIIEDLKKLDSDLRTIDGEIKSLTFQSQKVLTIKYLWIPLILIFSGLILSFFTAVHSLFNAGGISVGIAVLSSKLLRYFKIRSLIKSRHKNLSYLRKEVEKKQYNLKFLLRGLPVKDIFVNNNYDEFFINLLDLKTMFKFLDQLDLEQVSIKNNVKDKISEIKNLTTRLSLTENVTINVLVKNLEEKLEEALLGKKDKDKAEQEIIQRIDPEIFKINSKIQRICQEISRFESKFKEIGSGDLYQGVSIVKKRRNALNRAQSLKKDLEKIFPDFYSDEDTRKQIIGRKDDLEEKAAEFQMQLEKIKQEIEAKNQELSNYPTLFAYVDEPIKRFFMYGEETAEKFLIDSVQLPQQVLTDGVDGVVSDNMNLPDRVIEVFKTWWSEKGEATEREKPPLSNKFVTPYLIFDPIHFNILLKTPPQYFDYSDDVKTASINIFDPVTNEAFFKGDLKLYRNGEHSIITENRNFEISFPVTELVVNITLGNQTFTSKHIPCFKPEKPFLFFSVTNQRLIDTNKNQLPCGQIWLVLSKQYSILPKESILEYSEGTGRFYVFAYYLIDTKNVSKIDLLKNDKIKFSIPVLNQSVESIPHLTGKTHNCARAVGEDIFVDRPPILQIPFEDEQEINVWSLFIHSQPGSKPRKNEFYRLSEFKDYLFCQDSIYLSLDMTNVKFLGKNPIGSFQLHLRGIKNFRETFSFFFLSRLNIQFENPLYFPMDNESRNIKINVETPPGIEFKAVNEDNNLTNSNSFDVNVVTDEDYIEGRLTCLQENAAFNFPLEIKIPKVKWRIYGINRGNIIPWSDRIQEIFLDDLKNYEKLFLGISIPQHLKGTGHLNLCGHNIERHIQDGLLQFNLSQFSDTLRSGEAIEVLKLQICTEEFQSDFQEILQIRTRWEIQNIQVLQTDKNEKRILTIYWDEEKGTPAKKLKLWSFFSEEGEQIFEKPIERGETSLEQAFNKEQLPAGKYLLHFDFDFDDPWASTNDIIPDEHTPNTLLFDVTGDYYCGEKNCNFITKNEEEIFEHIKEAHLVSLFPHLTYEELKQQINDRDLPDEIYKCGYAEEGCRFYCGGYYPNPTDQIIHHIEDKCEYVKRGIGPVKVKFRVVSDVNEIRSSLINNLPYLYKCSVCNKQFKNFNSNIMLKHILKDHRDQIIIQK